MDYYHWPLHLTSSSNTLQSGYHEPYHSLFQKIAHQLTCLALMSLRARTSSRALGSFLSDSGLLSVDSSFIPVLAGLVSMSINDGGAVDFFCNTIKANYNECMTAGAYLTCNLTHQFLDFFHVFDENSQNDSEGVGLAQNHSQIWTQHCQLPLSRLSDCVSKF